MSPLSDGLLANFLPAFLTGMSINFTIAGIALAVGLALGLRLPALVFTAAPPASEPA